MLIQSIAGVVKLQISKWLKSPKAWISFVLLFLVVGGMANDYVKCARHLGTSIQVFEIFVMVCSYRVSFMFYIFGLALLLSDAPFFDDNASYYISRLKSRKWQLGVSTYILFACFLYAATILIVSFAFSFGILSIKNEWSQVAEAVSNNAVPIATGQGIYIAPNVMHAYSPTIAMLCQFLLLLLYGYLIGMLIYTVNLTTKRGMGFIVAVAFHALMFVISLDNLPTIRYFSLYNHASLSAQTGTISFGIAVAVLSFLSIGITVVGKHMIAKADIAPATLNWIE